MIGKGAEVNRQDNLGQSALHYATRYNQSKITEVIAKAGGDPNLSDKNGMTPMLNACKVGNDATVELLLKKVMSVFASTLIKIFILEAWRPIPYQ